MVLVLLTELQVWPLRDLKNLTCNFHDKPPRIGCVLMSIVWPFTNYQGKCVTHPFILSNLEKQMVRSLVLPVTGGDLKTVLKRSQHVRLALADMMREVAEGSWGDRSRCGRGE